MTNPLDNPGPLVADRAHARFAERRGKVLRYQVDVSPFLAMPEEPDESDWADAAWLAGPGGLLPLAGVSAPPPAGRLVRAVGAGIRARGEIPFLHAVATNPAISLYEKLGFQLRRKTAFSAARIPETLLAGPGGTRLMPGRCRYLSATSRLNKTDRISRIQLVRPPSMGRHPVSETLTSPYDIRPASPLIGAEIEGVDLTQPVVEATAEALREAFWTHKVLVFRNQHLSPLQHVEAVRIFDQPFDHPLWVKRHPDSRLVYTFSYEQGTADRWHIGGTWRNPPFHIESLTYQVVPEVGGHTLWADLQAAYDSLSEPVKQLLESVSAVYSAYPGDGTPDRPPVTETIEHPVVRTHRHTGRKGLFISTGALRLTGVTEDEGQALLPFLLAHASSPNYTVSFGWKPGDFVLWDNLATWHYAVNDYTGPRAYRKVIAG